MRPSALQPNIWYRFGFGYPSESSSYISFAALPMPSYAGSSAARDDIAGTLRLLLFLGLAIGLMIADNRMGWLRSIRAQGETLVQPLWRVAGLPAKLGHSLRGEAATRAQLADENRNLRNALLINRARLARLHTAAAENARLRGLLGVAEQGSLDVQLAPILDIALDPTQQRLVLDLGANRGVTVGQAVIDAGGLMGQVVEVHPNTSIVLLLTDPDHAVPVAIARNGIRLVAYGRGDRIELANVPMSSDVKVGDVVVTSGLGGRFPPGFPVGTIAKLQPNESRAFLVGELKPAAQLDRGRDVLLLKRVLRPLPAPTATDSSAKADAKQTATAQATSTQATTANAQPAVAAPTSAKPAQAKPARAKPATVKPSDPRPTQPAQTPPNTLAPTEPQR
jgi:rod shape-determining protein MreC